MWHTDPGLARISGSGAPSAFVSESRIIIPHRSGDFEITIHLANGLQGRHFCLGMYQTISITMGGPNKNGFNGTLSCNSCERSIQFTWTEGMSLRELAQTVRI